MPLPKTRSRLESDLGMLYYSTDAPPIGGRLRQLPEDFIVEEISPEGLLVNRSLERLDRGEGRFTLAVLEKRSKDLITLVSVLERKLGAQVGYAGIKDRNALTCQLISVGLPLGTWLPPTDIDGVRIRAIGSARWPVRPGDLLGNHFTIVIRGLTAPPDGSTLNPPWVPNYFGHQRFGVTRPNTHKVGKLLLKGDFEGAVREFLASPYPGEPEEAFRARKELRDSWDLRRAESSFPRSLSLERAVIRRLLERPGDYEGAILALPSDLRRLFVNAYQSYLFNLALSRRLEEAGPFAVSEGDFVSPLDRTNLPSRPIRCDCTNLTKLRSWVGLKKAVVMVHIPGFRTRLSGIDAEIYGEILSEEGISQSDFAEVRGAHFEGAMRPAVFWPVSFEPGQPKEDELNPGSCKIALRMVLPRGCFATVILREIMKPEDPAASGF
ncbi:MAG: tRNA pseudouridine(13) synthase TruD [Candidatus Verstraetearchaeota archaeon]|nr:tRNA pseudouridine(13) synthase TruD [Candidatus Verstraetearchaeota archaeon]